MMIDEWEIGFGVGVEISVEDIVERGRVVVGEGGHNDLAIFEVAAEVALGEVGLVEEEKAIPEK